MRALATVLLLAGAVAAQADPDGLVREGNWQPVQQQCGICHSLQLVTQNRGTREQWLRLLRWMQQTQGLWELPDALENDILDYLARYYAPEPPLATRRPPLAPELRP